MKHLFLVFAASCMCINAYGITIQGDPNATGDQTFSFQLTTSLYNAKNNILWTFNNAPIAVDIIKPYGLSKISNSGSVALPLLKEKITITTTNDGTATTNNNQTNPMWGNGFAQVILSGQDDTIPLFYLQDGAETKNPTVDVYALRNITSSTTDPNLLRTSPKNDLDQPAAIIQILAAPSSTLLTMCAADNAIPTRTAPSFISYMSPNATTGILEKVQNINIAAEILPELSTSPQTLNNTNTHLCATLSYGTSLFLGFDLTAGATPTNTVGVMHKQTDGTYEFFSLLSDNSVVSVLTAAAGQTKQAYSLNFLNTSTGLSYLAVGMADGGNHHVYALPLVTESSNFGLIADANQITSVVNNGQGITGYRFSTPLNAATQTSQIQTTNSAIVVGQGEIPGTQVFDVITFGDSIYVNTDTGVYYSQVLFTNTRTIFNWTPWRPAFGFTEQSNYFYLLNNTTSWSMETPVAGGSAVRRTEWSGGKVYSDFASLAQGTFDNGIVQGLFSLMFINNFYVLIGTGKNSIIVTNSGGTPISPDTTIIGNTVAATWATDNAQNWIFVGGQNGLGVFAQADGAGFTTTPASLSDVFPVGGDCNSIGNFSYIKKLQSIEDTVYVLQRDGVYAFTVDQTKFTADAPAALEATKIFDVKAVAGQNAWCTDMIGSRLTSTRRQLVIGTTAGLYFYDEVNGISSITLPNLQSVNRIEFPAYGNGITSTNMYVLAADFANQQAEIVRYQLFDFGGAGGQPRLIQDYKYVNTIAPLVTYIYFKDVLWYGGSFIFSVTNKRAHNPMIFDAIVGVKGYESSAQRILLYDLYPLTLPIDNPIFVTNIVQDPATGVLLLAGNFGIQELS